MRNWVHVCVDDTIIEYVSLNMTDSYQCGIAGIVRRHVKLVYVINCCSLSGSKILCAVCTQDRKVISK